MGPFCVTQPNPTQPVGQPKDNSGFTVQLLSIAFHVSFTVHFMYDYASKRVKVAHTRLPSVGFRS